MVIYTSGIKPIMSKEKYKLVLLDQKSRPQWNEVAIKVYRGYSSISVTIYEK